MFLGMCNGSVVKHLHFNKWWWWSWWFWCGRRASTIWV